MQSIAYNAFCNMITSTAIDNILMDYSRLESSYTSSLINGLSERDAQFLTINEIWAPTNKIPKQQWTRLINSDILATFQALLEREMWESVYQKQGANCTFNSFLSTFLNIIEASFPVIY
jgi:hypothetical protein